MITCRSVGQAVDMNSITVAATAQQAKRRVSAVKTILLVSGSFFIVYVPTLVFRWVLYGTISAIDIETRRYPGITMLVRCSTLVMTTSTPVVNPLLYFTTRKKLKISLFALLPWLHRLTRIRINRVSAERVVTSDENPCKLATEQKTVNCPSTM